MKTSDFINKWIDFKGQNGYLQRLDPNHPLDFFIGVSQNGYDELVLVTRTEPAKMISSTALEVEKAIRKDGRWATQIYSIKNENQQVFARFCLDLVDCSRTCKTEMEGLSCVTRRYLEWQKLFARLKETLSIRVLKGLIGEIDFAKFLILNGLSKDEVMNSWVGPSGADRDFILNDIWYENKAIATGKDKITISSLNQLDTENEGVLTVINIDESACTDPMAFSVKKYIDDFRLLLDDAPEAARLFEEKLLSLGYLDKIAYNDIFFVKGKRDYYKVDELFPKLVVENVHSSIVAVQYDLSLAGIANWKINEEEIIWN